MHIFLIFAFPVKSCAYTINFNEECVETLKKMFPNLTLLDLESDLYVALVRGQWRQGYENLNELQVQIGNQ